jgi:CPA1 family monovalent cation:H+ antiporter
MSVSQIGLILLIACVVAVLSRRVRLPYSVGLVLAGTGLSWFTASANLALTPELIYKVLLPPLIFEAALQLDWREFRNELPLTSVLAFPGTVIAAAIVAAGMHVILRWGWLGAGLFGTLIAATDPVSVIAAFKDMRVTGRLSLLVEAESLLNDGAAAVMFAVLLAAGEGSSLQVIPVVGRLLWMVGGGVAVGAAGAGALLVLAGRTEDRLVELTLTTVAAYGSFLLAERLGMSGVLASLAAGLVVGHVGWRGAISQDGRGQIVLFWEYMAFLSNSIIFILIGAREAQYATQVITVTAAAAIGLVLLGRVAAVYPLCAVFAGSRWRVGLWHQHVLVWGGLRGALALALALAVPASVPERQGIISAAFAVVAFSVFVQGITMPLLIKRAGWGVPPPPDPPSRI